MYALKNTDIERLPQNYSDLSIDAALRAESVALSMRHLVFHSCIPITLYHTMLADAHGITVRQEPESVTITMPGLLPKRRRKASNEFLIEPLYAALTRYTKTNTCKRFNECVVCICLVYNKEMPERRVRDYDNIELKHILDTVATFFMQDDNGLLCDVYHTTEFGTTDSTRITIMERDAFGSWLEQYVSQNG